jgi:hypothetical protein
MKRIKFFAILTLVFTSFQSYAQVQSTIVVDSSETVRQRAKLWLKAFDLGKVTALKQLSAEGTTECDLQFLIDLHLKEDSMYHWSKATWWTVKKDTVCGIIGFMVTPSFDLRPGETVLTAPSLPLFLHTKANGKWVVNIYFSQFDLIECPCQMTEEERKRLLKNDY